jgi:hypothetical protein
MSNSLLTPSIITKECVREFKNQLVAAKHINKEYNDQFAKKGAKVGDTINIRKPARYVANSGAALIVQDSVDESVPLQLDQQQHVGINFTSKDMTLSIDEFSTRYIKPAMTALANKVDLDCLALYKKVPNYEGTLGTPPSAFSTVLAAGAKLDLSGCPMDGQRFMVVDPLAQASLVDNFKAFQESSKQIASQYEKGKMGEAGGFKWYMSQNVNRHTFGVQGGTPAVATTVSTQGATTIALSGWTAAAANRLKAGDTFTVANVLMVNPVNKQATSKNQQFTVVSDFDSISDGTGTVTVYPAMYTSGPRQNINRFPTSADVLTIGGTTALSGSMNLAFHKDAFVLGTADLIMPQGVDMAARVSDEESGISMRMVRQYDINNDSMPCRVDILYGMCAVYPEWAVRVMG